MVAVARGRQYERPLAAVEQGNAQAAFHLLDVLASRRLAHTAVRRSLAHAVRDSYLFEKA
jgi:hypothetical protein